jgi:hypothetical protein
MNFVDDGSEILKTILAQIREHLRAKQQQGHQCDQLRPGSHESPVCYDSSLIYSSRWLRRLSLLVGIAPHWLYMQVPVLFQAKH